MPDLPPVTKRSHRSAVFAGGRHAWIPITLVLLAHFPGRHVYAANEATHGRPFWQFLCAGLLGDLLYVGPPVLVAFVLPLACGAILARRTPRAQRVGVFAALALSTPILVSAWMFSVAAIESKIERGLYPTYLETKTALESTSFVFGQLPALGLDRYRLANLAVATLSVGLLARFRVEARRTLKPALSVLGFALTGTLILAFAALAVARGKWLFPKTGSYLETRSPLEIVALGRFPFPNHTPVTDGMRQVFGARTFPPEDVSAGVRELGFAKESTTRLLAFEHGASCEALHPLARPLDRAANPEAPATALLGDLEGLSRALFDGRDEPLVVFQVAMESFRADDVRAFHAEAPPELTPNITRIVADSTRSVPFYRAFQGGFRTAQALSSLMCGIGSLPFNIAIARDLGHFPLRCLPDVLRDAGFDTHTFYGADIAYDSMLEFLRYHDVDVTHATDMPEGLPVGSWHGVSDRALYTQALEHASAARRPLYSFILTLSGHSPFLRPTDMREEVSERAAAACTKSVAAASDDCRRLAVIAYADDALGEFLEALERSSVAGRSVVIFSADHATSEMHLWPGTTEAKGRAHVPYVIYLPQKLINAATHPDDVLPLLARLRVHAETLPISLMDSPTLVTALLSATPAVRTIPEPWRFHTFGGQTTSPDFGFDARPRARVWGTDSAAFVFSVDPDGSVIAYENKNRAFSGPDELDQLNPSLRGPAAFLSTFVKGYMSRCETHAQLRASTKPRALAR
jgi:phosphoglycerol transferase MdoB-like AlkP superfamily enzyme